MLWWKDIWWWSLESVQYFLHASCMSNTAVVILIHRVIAHTCANTWVLEPTLFMAITVSQIQHSWHSCWCHRVKKKKKINSHKCFSCLVFFCLRRDSHSFLTFWNHKFRAASSEVTKRGSVGGLHTQSMSHTVLYRHSMLLCLHSWQRKL